MDKGTSGYRGDDQRTAVRCGRDAICLYANWRSGCDTSAMESLALIVAIIVAISFVGGPVSVLLSFLPQPAAKVGTVVFGGSAAVVSVYLLVVSSAIGGRLFALFGLATSGFALWRLATSKRRTPKWDTKTPPGRP